MKFLGIILFGIKALAALLGIPQLIDRFFERRRAREGGIRDQRLANAEEQLEQAREANANAEAVARLSDDELDAELRRDARTDPE